MKNRVSLIFMITESCNCGCFFCSRNNIHKSLHDPKVSDILRSLQILAEQYPNSKLIISGGEPTLSNDFMDIVKYAVTLFPKVEVQTNGTFSIEVAVFLQSMMQCYNLHVQFSLDGLKEVHNNIRGEGVFETVIHNINYLQDVYNQITISTTVTPYNRASVLELCEFLNELKFRRVSISIAQPNNPAHDEIINYLDWNKFVDKVLTVCHYRLDISKLYDFKLMDDFLATNQVWHGYTNCGRGITHIYIKSNFDVLPCTCISEKVGNLLIDDILTIRAKLEEQSKIIISELSPCFNCKYKLICNGGCPGISTKIFGKPNMGDIRCPYVYKWAIDNGYFH